MATKLYDTTISKNDITLAVSKTWDTALRSHFNEKANNKRIPTNAKGFRLDRQERFELKASEDGHLYIVSTSKYWDEDGTCLTEYSLMPMTSAKCLVNAINAGYGLDSWGNSYASLYVYKNGKRSYVGGLGAYNDNAPILHRIVDAWVANGYKFYSDDCSGVKFGSAERKAYRS